MLLQMIVLQKIVWGVEIVIRLNKIISKNRKWLLSSKVIYQCFSCYIRFKFLLCKLIYRYIFLRKLNKKVRICTMKTICNVHCVNNSRRQNVK